MHLPPAQAPELTRFAPSAQQADQILSDLSDPAQSLLSVARSHNTTAEFLSLWLSRPEISERIATMRAAAALRTRWLAAEHLPACAELASRIVRASLNSPDLSTPDSALRAARLLLRLATFDPDRPRSAPKPHHTPDPNSPPSRTTSHASSVLSVPSDPFVLSDPPEPPTAASRTPSRTEPQSESASTTSANSPSSDSLDLPSGLLAALLPSFKHADRNPFLPEPGLLKTAPNQRALVKMRLKQQRKQVLDEALHFLLQNNCCTESQFPLARREIEAFYLRGETELPSSSASRAPPLPQSARNPLESHSGTFAPSPHAGRTA
ncbi:MAG: hypothetical protein JNK16_00385 [Phycisphaerales bacterium]|nr:hypothetical protein [Phycisphaerales bacterium]